MRGLLAMTELGVWIAAGAVLLMTLLFVVNALLDWLDRNA